MAMSPLEHYLHERDLKRGERSLLRMESYDRGTSLIKAAEPQPDDEDRARQTNMRADFAAKMYHRLRNSRVPEEEIVTQIAAKIGVRPERVDAYVKHGRQRDVQRAESQSADLRTSTTKIAGGQRADARSAANAQLAPMSVMEAKQMKMLMAKDDRGEATDEEIEDLNGLMHIKAGRNSKDAQAYRAKNGEPDAAVTQPEKPKPQAVVPADPNAPEDAASSEASASAPASSQAAAPPPAESAPPTEEEMAPSAGSADPNGPQEEEAPQGGGDSQLNLDAMMADEGEEEKPKPKRKKKVKNPNEVPEGAVEVPEEPQAAPQPEEAPAPEEAGPSESETPPDDQANPMMADEPEQVAPPQQQEAAAPKPKRVRRQRAAAPQEGMEEGPKAAHGGPVTETGEVMGGGGTQRKQGLGVDTVRGPNGGFYQVTQNGNYRRISQREYSERQGKGNQPRHASKLGPEDDRNGPMDAYHRWNEMEGMGHKPFHSSNVTATTHHKTGESIDELSGPEAMHGTDAAREEYQEHMSQQAEERKASREADHSLTNHAHKYERPETPGGHFQGKKNLTTDDVRAHIRALSEFTGLGGKAGHRMSWVVEPEYHTIYRDGKKYRVRKNEGGGRAIDFDVKENEDGSMTVQGKLLSYAPTHKKLSAKQIAYLIATGQIHPANNKHNPESVKDFGQEVTLSAEDLKNGNMLQLNNLMSHCAETSHNMRGARVNRRMHDLYEAHGAGHHNWRYDQMFNTAGRGGTGAHAQGRAGGGSYEAHGGKEQPLAASMTSLRESQMATYLGPDWRAKLATAVALRKAGVPIEATEVDGERYLHTPVLVSLTKADTMMSQQAMMRAAYAMIAASGGSQPPRIAGDPLGTVERLPPPPATHTPTRQPREAAAPSMRPPRTPSKFFETVNGGPASWRPAIGTYDGRGNRQGLASAVLAALKGGNPDGDWESTVSSHTWRYGPIRMDKVHAVGVKERSFSPEKADMYRQNYLDGIALPPIVCIAHGASNHILDGRHRYVGAFDAGMRSLFGFIGTPKRNAAGYQTSDGPTATRQNG